MFTTRPAGTEIFVRINETGRLFDIDGESEICSAEATGPEFNPMAEFDKHGKRNPFQDPSRGKINSCTVDVDEGGEFCQFDQKPVLQNIHGKDGILGRSLTFYAFGEGDTDVILGCCTIGLDVTPDYYKMKIEE